MEHAERATAQSAAAAHGHSYRVLDNLRTNSFNYSVLKNDYLLSRANRNLIEISNVTYHF